MVISIAVRSTAVFSSLKADVIAYDSLPEHDVSDLTMAFASAHKRIYGGSQDPIGKLRPIV